MLHDTLVQLTTHLARMLYTGKEIQLKHRAPVITVSVIDGDCNDVDGSKASENSPPHRVIITSEEQIKV